MLTTTTGEARTYTLPTRDGPVDLHGILLGEGTSKSELHNHITDVAEPGQKCKACRWSEVRIFRLVETQAELSKRTHPARTGNPFESMKLREKGPQLGAYVIHTSGCTIVPDEVTKIRLVRTDDVTAVIGALIVRKYVRGRLEECFITRPAQDALDDAADHDEALGHYFDEWITDPAHEALLDAA